MSDRGQNLGALGDLVASLGLSFPNIDASLAQAGRLQEDFLEALAMIATPQDLDLLARQTTKRSGLLTYHDLEHADLGPLTHRCAELNWFRVRVRQWGQSVQSALAAASPLFREYESHALSATELSDDAHFNRRVVAVGPAGGRNRYVYKPGSYPARQAWAQMTEQLNVRLSIRILSLNATSLRDDLVDFVESKDPLTSQLTNYYRCFGITLGALRALGASDGHFENFITTPEGPLLIDVETAFAGGIVASPSGKDPFGESFLGRISDSVLGTGVVSRPHKIDSGEITDWAALRQDTDTPLPTRKVGLRIRADSEGRLSLSLIRQTLPLRAPTMPGTWTMLSREETAKCISDGMQEFDAAWLGRGSNAFVRIVQNAWEGVPVRRVERPTHVYMRALWRMRLAEAGLSALPSDSGPLHDDVDTVPQFTQNEKEVLASGNVPTYHQPASGITFSTFRERLCRIQRLDETVPVHAALGLREEGLDGLRRCALGPYLATTLPGNHIVSHPVGFSTEFGMGGALPVVNALDRARYPLPSCAGDAFVLLSDGVDAVWPEPMWAPGGELHGLLVLALQYPSIESNSFAAAVWHKLQTTDRLRSSGGIWHVHDAAILPVAEAAALILERTLKGLLEVRGTVLVRRSAVQVALVRGAMARLDLPGDTITDANTGGTWIEKWLAGCYLGTSEAVTFANNPGLLGWTGGGIRHLTQSHACDYVDLFLTRVDR